ncbi:MAG TPA: xanthine dehydrogenase accessory protein XdhC, partial [Aestuariivirgaceae bacterium]|nr:xanthine dehydrogenase accessory protein XdhC [Aestuariivirgaceae bacterium]
RMVVMPDGGFRGTIGGGALEWRGLADARTLLAQDAPQARLRRQALGPELGQCCGGSVRLLIEVFDRTMTEEVASLAAREAGGDFVTSARLSLVPAKAGIQGGKGKESGSPLSRGRAEVETRGALSRMIIEVADSPRLPVEIAPDGSVFETFARHSRPLTLFGAGHVGRALILALAPLPFEVAWIDPRRDAFPAAMPANVRAVHLPDPAAALAGAPAGGFVLVMTHSHGLDLELVHAALAADRFAYVGLIGSATKRARFRHRLKAIGLSDAALSRLVCPIGLAGINSKAPAAIAASVAADLLIRHESATLAKLPVAAMAERA